MNGSGSEVYVFISGATYIPLWTSVSAGTYTTWPKIAMEDYGVTPGVSNPLKKNFSIDLDIYYHLDYYYDSTSPSGGTGVIHYDVGAYRSYQYTIFIDQTSAKKHHVSDLKTIHHSGYYIKYDSTSTNYSSILAEGQIYADDITGELYVETTTYKSYFIIKNKLNYALQMNGTAGPEYRLQAKFKINVAEWTTTKQTELEF